MSNTSLIKKLRADLDDAKAGAADRHAAAKDAILAGRNSGAVVAYVIFALAADKIRSALHEAAHAVVLEYRGASVSSVEIGMRSHDYADGVFLEHGRTVVSRCNPAQEAIGRAAGPLGQAHLSGEPIEPETSEHDEHRIRQILAGDARMIALTKRRARIDVVRMDGIIAVVAAALIERESISGDELRALIASANL